MYITAFDIYKIFIEEKNKYLKKDNNFNPNNFNKLSDMNKCILEHMSQYFNTIYHNIDINLYIELGFKNWKSFNIGMLNDERLLQKYKSYDKITKRSISKYTILKSIDYINENGGAVSYCDSEKINDVNVHYPQIIIRKPIIDYLHNKIDCVILVYLLEKKLLKKLGFEEKDMLSYIMNNYKDVKAEMYKYYNIIKGKLNE